MSPAEPPQMLDAIAANPDDESAWHVLADWLLENGAPHGALAAYDLKIGWGTRDAELLGDYVAGRRERHRLLTLGNAYLDPVEWRCGYVIRATVSAWQTEANRRDDTKQMRALLAQPQLVALHQLTLRWERIHSSLPAALGAVLEAAPGLVRRLSVRGNGEGRHATLAALEPLIRLRPPKAVRLDLSLSSLVASEVLPELARAGWSTLDLDGTEVRGAAELPRLVRDLPGTTFLLGGTGLPRPVAAQLDLPNVVFVPDDAAAVLLDAEGRIHPLRKKEGTVRVAGLLLSRDLLGWSCSGRPVSDGDELTATTPRGERTLLFREGPGLDGWYRGGLRS